MVRSSGRLRAKDGTQKTTETQVTAVSTGKAQNGRGGNSRKPNPSPPQDELPLRRRGGDKRLRRRFTQGSSKRESVLRKTGGTKGEQANRHKKIGRPGGRRKGRNVTDVKQKKKSPPSHDSKYKVIQKTGTKGRGKEAAT